MLSLLPALQASRRVLRPRELFVNKSGRLERPGPAPDILLSLCAVFGTRGEKSSAYPGPAEAPVPGPKEPLDLGFRCEVDVNFPFGPGGERAHEPR
jgi:hypothetical protein